MPAHSGFAFQIRLWLENEEGFSLGQGMVRLLTLVEERGSLSRAAEEMGMSYRRAWGRLKRHEQALGYDLLHKPGGNKGGYSLTAEGRRLLSSYTRWFRAVQNYAAASVSEHFGEPIPLARSKGKGKGEQP